MTPTSSMAPGPAVASPYAGLFRAVTGLRNGRAIVAMLACTAAGALVAGAAIAAAGVIGFLGPLLAFVVWFVALGTGVNAAGLLQMDAARGLSPRSLPDALVGGLLCIPKIIVLALAVIAAQIVLFIAIALLLFICKIPGLGAVLYTVVFPVCVVVAGLTIAALFLGVVLSVPAIWQGAGITRALAQTFAILRSRLVEAVLLLLVVGFLSAAVAFVVFGVLGAGLMPVIAMSASVLGVGGLGIGGGSLAGMGGVMGGMGGMGTGGGHVVAGMIGGSLLWVTALSLVAQVYLLGLCITYLNVTDGLDLSAAEATLRNRLDEAKRKTQEMSERARAAARPVEPATPARTATAASPVVVEPGATSAGAAPFAAAAGAVAAGAAAWPPAAAGGAAAGPAGPGAMPPEVQPAASPAPFPPAVYAEDPLGTPAGATSAPSADIDLPFDDPPLAAPPSNGPPAWAPPLQPPPAAATPPVAAPAVSACPQCLSAVTPDDVFCGVCGFRLR